MTLSVGAGRTTPLIAELDELVARNEAAPNADREARIIELRNAAFAEVRMAKAGSLPEVGSIDPATGSISLDDLKLADRSAAALRVSILKYGCAYLPDAVDPSDVAVLVDSIDQTFDAFDRVKAKTATPESNAWFRPFNPPNSENSRQPRTWNREGGGILASDSPRGHFRLVQVLRSSGIVGLIDSYFDETAALSVNKSTLRRAPRSIGTGDWHQDGAFMGQGIRTVNVWLALSDCGVDAPGLDIVPRRLDLAPTGTLGANFDWAVSPDVVADVAEPVGVIRPHFKAGDVLLFDHFFLHRTGGDETMSNDRYAIESWFFAPSCYPDTQFPMAL